MRLFFAVISLFLAIGYLGTLPLDLIDIDSSQYAMIVWEMNATGEYHRILDNGRPYLDKPILTFWTIAPFMKVFGPENWAYRLPAILITFLSVFALYRLVLLLGGSERRAWIAAIVYFASPGLYAMVVDPKIDVYLTAYLIFTHYFYYKGRKEDSRWFYAMYLSIGLGFISKGPISMGIPAISIGGDILFRRDWKLLGSMRIHTGLPIAISLPALWAYLLFTEYSSYGPSFFLWIQSFGRFYKDLYDVKYDPFFFVNNFSWAFLTFILPLAVTSFWITYQFWKRLSLRECIRKIRENEFRDRDYTFGFWLFLFLFLISFSRFQLPQYVFWILPAAAVIFSDMVEKQLFSEHSRRTHFSYHFAGYLYFAFLLVFPFFVFENPWQMVWIPVLGIVVLVWSLRYSNWELALPMVGVASTFLMISLYIYPLLLSYQPASVMGRIVRELEPKYDTLYTYKISSSKRSYGFYSQRKFRNIYDRSRFLEVLDRDRERLVVVPEDTLSEFQSFLGGGVEMTIVDQRPSYKVATPRAEFFLKSQRKKLTREILLVSVKKS